MRFDNIHFWINKFTFFLSHFFVCQIGIIFINVLQNIIVGNNLRQIFKQLFRTSIRKISETLLRMS